MDDKNCAMLNLRIKYTGWCSLIAHPVIRGWPNAWKAGKHSSLATRQNSQCDPPGIQTQISVSYLVRLATTLKCRYLRDSVRVRDHGSLREASAAAGEP